MGALGLDAEGRRLFNDDSEIERLAAGTQPAAAKRLRPLPSVTLILFQSKIKIMAHGGKRIGAGRPKGARDNAPRLSHDRATPEHPSIKFRDGFNFPDLTMASSRGASPAPGAVLKTLKGIGAEFAGVLPRARSPNKIADFEMSQGSAVSVEQHRITELGRPPADVRDAELAPGPI
jgi:hypothetical protein